tara:strand:- start:399 stop:1580 length:1182 start_codon:yes stop_codon:yes gene_type:complete
MYKLSDYVDFSKINDVEYMKQKGLKSFKLSALTLIKYNKEKLNSDNLNTLGLFRSVIVDGERIISYSPPKSIPHKTFNQENDFQELNYIQRYIEGTMINVFWNDKIGDWDIATRSNIGARCHYNVLIKETFRYMFLDTMNKVNLDFDDLNKNYSYCFIMQHPKNRIVTPIKNHKLYLCNVYRFENFNVYTVNDNEIGAHLINFKIKNILDNTNDLKQIYETNKYEDDYEKVGIVFKNSQGQRCKVRNSAYEYVRRLKGNSPKLQFQYYNLKQQNKIKEYLKYYPEQTETFMKMRDDLYEFTNKLYSNYISCYIKKENPLKEFPYQYRSHMFNIHQHYLNELKEQHKFINKREVINYINKLEPARLMYSMNINYRKSKIETRTNEEKNFVDELI